VNTHFHQSIDFNTPATYVLWPICVVFTHLRDVLDAVDGDHHRVLEGPQEPVAPIASVGGVRGKKKGWPASGSRVVGGVRGKKKGQPASGSSVSFSLVFLFV